MTTQPVFFYNGFAPTSLQAADAFKKRFATA